AHVRSSPAVSTGPATRRRRESLGFSSIEAGAAMRLACSYRSTRLLHARALSPGRRLESARTPGCRGARGERADAAGGHPGAVCPVGLRPRGRDLFLPLRSRVGRCRPRGSPSRGAVRRGRGGISGRFESRRQRRNREREGEMSTTDEQSDSSRYSRRGFLKRAGAGAGTVALGGGVAGAFSRPVQAARARSLFASTTSQTFGRLFPKLEAFAPVSD